MAELNRDTMFFQNNTQAPTKAYEYFTVLGDHDFMDDDHRPRANDETSKVVAKTSSVNNHPARFFIKVGTYGKIFNPIGLFSEGKNSKFLSKIGRKEFEFKEVNQKVFDLYVKFLSTKNLAWLNNAERELV
ncbi:MAG: hypothetical protein ACKO7N_06745 [Candidatus Nitrosotenuis sp.]